MAEKTRDIIDANRAYSNEGNGENKCSYSKLITKKWVEFILRYNLYTMDLDYKRNCYNYRGFKYIEDTVGIWRWLVRKDRLVIRTIIII